MVSRIWRNPLTAAFPTSKPVTPFQPEDSDQVRVESLDTPYQGFFRLDRFQLRHRLFAGGWTPLLKREILRREYAVGILPYDPLADAVVLVEQFRMGPFVAGVHPWMLEIPAGVVKPGETLEQVARRETVEETGCVPARVERFCDYFPSPGGCSEAVSLFVAEIRDTGNAGRLHGVADEHEDIQTHILPVPQALALLDADAYANSATLLALNWLARHHSALRQRWQEPPPENDPG